MKLFTTVLAVLVLVAASEAGSKCIWGPSYWCQSAENAKECGKESYCEQSVWKVKAESSVKGAIECDACKLVMSKVMKLVETNATEAEVLVALKKVCVYLGPLKDQCESLEAKYLPEIWQLIVSESDPQKICEMVSLCTSRQSMQLRVQVKIDGCDICELVVNFLKHYVDANSTEGEVKSAVEKLCDLLPGSIGSECTSLVDDNFDLIWSLIKNDVDSDKICEQIGLCNSTSTGHQLSKSTPHQAVKADACDICKLVTSYLKTFVDGSDSEDKVKNYVEDVCKLLPGNTSMECTKLVDDNFDMIWMLLKDEVDSGDICKQIGLCNSTLTAHHKTQPLKGLKDEKCQICELVVKFVKPYVDSGTAEKEVNSTLLTLCSFLPGDSKQECKDFVNENLAIVWKLLQSEVDQDVICKQIGLCSSKVAQKAVSLPGVDGCDICKTVVTFLDVFVNKNSTETDVENALERFCGLIKSSECTSLLTEYFDLVWQLVKGELNNDEFCKQTSLCPSATTLSLKSRVKDSPLCQICELATAYLKNFVDDSSNEEEVQQEFEMVCALLPGNYSAQCKDFVDKYVPAMWKAIQDEVDTDKLCTDVVKVCVSSAPVVQTPVKADVLCDVCHVVVPFLRHFVDSNSTEVEAKAALESLCGKLPQQYGDQCSSLVDEYFSLIWNLLQSYVDDDKICSELKLCTTSVHVPVVAVQTQAPEGAECVLCEFVMKEIDSLLNGNTTEAAIENALDKVCEILPSTVKDVCDDFVSQYTPDIVQLLLQKLDPKQVCTELKLCTSTVQKVKSEPKAGIFCEICETVLNKLEDLIPVNATEAEIENALDSICDDLGVLKSTCESFVQQYTPQIVQYVLNQIAPEQICSMLGLCSTSKLTAVGKPHTVAAPKSGVLCVVCEYVMKELADLLDGNYTKVAVEDALDKVCSLMPSSVKHDCTLFVDKWTPEILDALLKTAAPKAVCALIHVCLLTEQQKPVELIKDLKLGVSDCDLCKTTLSLLKSLIATKAAEETIDDVLEKVCGLMPSEIKSECVGIVNKYDKQIIQLLADEIEPDVICRELKLCKSAKTSVLMTPWVKLARSRKF